MNPQGVLPPSQRTAPSPPPGLSRRSLVILGCVAAAVVIAFALVVRDAIRSTPPNDYVDRTMWKDRCVNDDVGDPAAAGRTDEVMRLITTGTSADSIDRTRAGTALYCAYNARRYDTAAAMLKLGAPPSGNVDLRLPIDDNDEAGARTLLDAGLPPDTDLAAAMQRQQYGIVAAQLDHGADPAHFAIRPVLRVVASGNDTAVALAGVSNGWSTFTLLLDHGADPDAMDDDFSPLALAAFAGNVPAVNALLAHGADPNHGGKGDTNMVAMVALSFTDPFKHAVPVELLPQVPKGRMMVTPLLAAIAQDNTQIVSLLLGAEADPNLAADGGFVPIYLAAILGQDTVVQALLFAGANPTPLLPPGLPTPAEAAGRANHPSTALLLTAPR